MSTSESRTDADMVRMELEADGHPLDAVTPEQIVAVGITPANLTVTEDLAGSGMSEDRLALIERYLAGHHILASGVDELRQTDSVSYADDSQASFAGDRDHTDYRSTSLGQKAINMDETGTLREAAKPTASIDVPDVR